MSKDKLQQLCEILSEEELNQLRDFSDHNKTSIENWLDDKMLAETDPPSREKFNKPQHLLNNLFLDAAERGDEQTVEFFLSNEFYKNKRDSLLHNALNVARKAGHQTVKDMLVEYGLEPQKKVKYETITQANGTLNACLLIMNRYDLLALDEVKRWFEDQSFKALVITQQSKMIKIVVKDSKLYEVINVLHENYLTLEDTSVKLIYKEFLRVGSAKTHIRHASVKKEKNVKNEKVAAEFQNLIIVFEDIYNRFIKLLSEEVKSKIFKKRKPVEEKPINKKLIAYAIEKIFLGVERDGMTDHINKQWSAHAPSPRCNGNFLEATEGFVNNLKNYNNRCKLNFDNMSDETKSALQNIIVYGDKLWNERDATHTNKKKMAALDQKIEALSTFIREIITQDDLSEETIKDSYNKLEQNDVNRGTGLYQFFTAVNKMWYTTDKGNKRPVKSTLGELGYYVMRAFVDQLTAKSDDEAEKTVAEETEVSLKSSR